MTVREQGFAKVSRCSNKTEWELGLTCIVGGGREVREVKAQGSREGTMAKASSKPVCLDETRRLCVLDFRSCGH